MTGRSALPLAIWVTGATLPDVERERGSFTDLIRTTVGSAWSGPWAVFDAVHDARGADNAATPLPDPDQIAGIIITGSPARIADQAPWMQRAQAHARTLAARGVPMLGICFGHQLLGVALGGRSGPNPRGREIGTVVVRRLGRSANARGNGSASAGGNGTASAAVFEADPAAEGAMEDVGRESAAGEDALLGDAPRRFFASMTHLDTVLELPPGSVVLAETAGDRCAAVRFAPRVWGVQFHPEMDGGIVARYITARAEALLAEGLDPEALLAECRDAPESAELLRRFAGICAAGE